MLVHLHPKIKNETRKMSDQESKRYTVLFYLEQIRRFFLTGRGRPPFVRGYILYIEDPDDVNIMIQDRHDVYHRPRQIMP